MSVDPLIYSSFQWERSEKIGEMMVTETATLGLGHFTDLSFTWQFNLDAIFA